MTRARLFGKNARIGCGQTILPHVQQGIRVEETRLVLLADLDTNSWWDLESIGLTIAFGRGYAQCQLIAERETRPTWRQFIAAASEAFTRSRQSGSARFKSSFERTQSALCKVVWNVPSSRRETLAAEIRQTVQQPSRAWDIPVCRTVLNTSKNQHDR